MGKGEEEQEMHQQLVNRSEERLSEVTDYESDPHIYSNVWQFVFSILGFNVGYGSFWRFPYLVYKNGGGVFLIPYFLSMVMIGIPCVYLEAAVGQMHRTSIPFILKKIHPAFKMLGIAILLASLHVVAYYNILLTYSYRFIFSAFVMPLPFGEQSINESTYFRETVLQQSSGIEEFGGINWTLFILFVLSMLLCHFIIKNGVKSSGNLIIYTASAPFVILFLLLVRGLFLSGAADGLTFIFKPDWTKLWTRQIWIDAIVQVFFQMGLGYGTTISLASMKPKREKFLTGIMMVPLGVIICGLLSAMTIFVYLSHFCQEIGMAIDDPALNIAGPELVFNVFPKALANLPLPNLLVFIFFCTMVLLGIDSQFGFMQGLYCYLNHQHKNRPVTILGRQLTLPQLQYVMILVALIPCPTLTSQAGLYYLQFYDYFISNIPFTLWVMAQIYFFVYLLPFQELQQAIVRYVKQPTPSIIRWLLQSKLLVALLCIIFATGVFNQLVIFTQYSLGFYLLGWAITLYPIALAYWYFRKHWTSSKDLKLTFYDIQHA